MIAGDAFHIISRQNVTLRRVFLGCNAPSVKPGDWFESLDMAYRSFREVLAGSTPASIRRLQLKVPSAMW
jgi:hypothetical protein